jgi:hypothetical protein
MCEEGDLLIIELEGRVERKNVNDRLRRTVGIDLVFGPRERRQ